jgi:hypothetical protein
MKLESDNIKESIKEQITVLEIKLSKLRKALAALEDLDSPANLGSVPARKPHGEAERILEEWLVNHGKTKVSKLHQETGISVPTIYYQAKKMPDKFFIENGYLCLQQAQQA